MSRVTINNLCDDFRYTAVTDDERKIEVVPRRMVEMIIEKCERDEAGPRPNDYIVGVSDEAYLIKDYANRLLSEFEEDK